MYTQSELNSRIIGEIDSNLRRGVVLDSIGVDLCINRFGFYEPQQKESPRLCPLGCTLVHAKANSSNWYINLSDLFEGYSYSFWLGVEAAFMQICVEAKNISDFDSYIRGVASGNYVRKVSIEKGWIKNE